MATGTLRIAAPGGDEKAEMDAEFIRLFDAHQGTCQQVVEAPDASWEVAGVAEGEAYRRLLDYVLARFGRRAVERAAISRKHPPYPGLAIACEARLAVATC